MSEIQCTIVLLNSLGSTAFPLLQAIALGTLAFLLWIGAETFRFTVTPDVKTDVNMWALARIRQYFRSLDLALDKHISWRITDEPTRWVTSNSSGIRRTAQAILCLLSGMTVGLTVHLFTPLAVSAAVYLFGPQQGGLMIYLSNPRIVLIIALIAAIPGIIGTAKYLDHYKNVHFSKAAKVATEEVRYPNTNHEVHEESDARI